jgi:1-deoxy-D-xylulose-5-phosphate synthase
MPVGQAEVLEGSNIMIWALGNMVPEALKLATRLEPRKTFPSAS